MNNNEPYDLSHLAVNGNDIKKLVSGSKIGDTLEYLLEEVIKDPSLNEYDTLISMVRSDKN